MLCEQLSDKNMVVGQSALNIAAPTSAHVIAKTRNPKRLSALEVLGAHGYRGQLSGGYRPVPSCTSLVAGRSYSTMVNISYKSSKLPDQ